MLFNSVSYAAFLLACFVVFWLLRARRLPRALFLVAASYAFYFYGTFDAAESEDVPFGPYGWAWLCLGIIFVGSTLDYGIGRALGRIESPRLRKALLLVSIFYYVGVLALFKYWNFAADSFASLFASAGLHVSPVHLRLALPFGISFFTFETMSYTIDVYRRDMEPAESYLDYLLFVCFFPHLVAGPIVRPEQMLPQLRAAPVFDEAKQARGLFRIGVGLAKKIAIGDVLAVDLVGRVFGNPERYSSLEVLVAVYAYALQIYADFSGYTDIALGSAALFGYELPENFDAPYVSRNLQDFWRRWHISLSSWLRDYLYIPLGGSRGTSLRTYRNLMITMLLGGLWHGASWNFVIWGALHGGALAVTRAYQRRSGAQEGDGSWAGRAVSVFFTFQYVCFAWIFFRAPTFGHATLVLEQIGRLTAGHDVITRKVVIVMLVGYALHFVPRRIGERIRDAFVDVPAWAQGVVLAVAAYALHLAAGSKAAPFVYGQF